MGWVKLDDSFFTHRKVIGLSHEAQLLFLAGLTHCARELTDGSLTAADIRMVAATVNVPVEIQTDLQAAGLWDLAGNGVTVHDYLDYNPTREQEMARREDTRLRVSQWRARNAVTNAVTNGVSTQNVTPAPVPVPVPVPESRIQSPEPTSTTLATEPRKKPRVNGAPASESSETWAAYSEAYEDRYHVRPTRNAKVNGQMCQFIQRVPSDEAPRIAAWFIGHNGRWYVEQGHSVGALLRDSEKLRTEWQNGHSMTARAARETDRLAGQGAIYLEVIEELKQQGRIEA